MAEMTQIFLFDMDGVLVDVSGSFRTIIRELVWEFTSETVTADDVQRLKEQGGFNDDVEVSRELIRRLGGDVPIEDVKRRFDELYEGTSRREGMYTRERWLVDPAVLERMGRRHRLGVVTGRTDREVDLARRIAPAAFEHLQVIVTQDDVPRGRLKPHPDSIILAMERLDAGEGFYVGDAVDDMEAGRAAGLTPIGVIPPNSKHPDRLREKLEQHGASTVLDSVDEIVRWA
jgi:HAD superfamily hydrolase (TIGR01548 family)